MTQVWENDKVIAVTPVLAGPCTVTQVKTKDSDGYSALQLAFGEKKKKNIKKPQIGHVKNLNINPRHLKEFRTTELGEVKAGDIINVATFEKGDIIAVTGVSKGKGFQGVVKRHGFKGQTTTHGTKDQVRMPGSVGPLGPAHVFKGTRMGGRMGGKKITTTNLEVVKVDLENNIILIKGALPGAVNGLVTINGQGELKLNVKPEVKKEEVVTEATAEKKEEVKPEETKPEEKKEEQAKEKTTAEPKAEAKKEEAPAKEEIKEEVPTKKVEDKKEVPAKKEAKETAKKEEESKKDSTK